MAHNPNTTGEGFEGAENTIDVSRGDVLLSTRTLLAGAALAILADSITPQTAMAEDTSNHIQVAGNTEESSFGLMTDPDELSQSIEIRSAIAELIRLRQDGSEYYGPYVQEFLALPEESQYQITQLIYPENSEGGSEYPEEVIELVRNLRLPESMIQTILEEAQSNGADDFFELPGYEETLYELRNNGDVGARSIGYIIERAPIISSQLYIVVLSNIVDQELVDAQGRLVDAQGRLVDAQGRLVDAQGQLILAQELEESVEDVADSADSLLGN